MVYVKLPDGIEAITEEEAVRLFGTPEYRQYVSRIYRGELGLEDVPEEYREAVATCVAERIKRWGSYDAQAVPSEEVLQAVQQCIKPQVNRSDASQLFKSISTLRQCVDDATASTAIGVFVHLRGDGELVRAGTRINWLGTLKRAAVDLWDVPTNNPDNAPTLWEDILYRDGIRIIPGVITVGLAFKRGELGWDGDVLYESLVDNNVYTPTQYPQNWKRRNNN